MSYFQQKSIPAARALSKRPGEWTSAEIAIVRRMAAAGAKAKEAAEAINSPLKVSSLIQRAKRLGISFRRSRAAYGEETTLPPTQGMKTAKSFRTYRPSTPEARNG